MFNERVSASASGDRSTAMRPWHFVVAFGIVSLLADMVYEGARSIIGPYLATLGASATVVGLVAGAGEFIGYGLTGVLAPALLLYATERLGKAVRSPAKDTLLSHASAQTGRGSAFGVHQALDQTGAMLGPLLLAAVLSWRDGDYRLAFGVLAVPGALVIALLLWLRHRVPDPLTYEEPGRHAPGADELMNRRLPRAFWQYVAAIAVLSCGVASFPLLAYHAQTRGLLSVGCACLARHRDLGSGQRDPRLHGQGGGDRTRAERDEGGRFRLAGARARWWTAGGRRRTRRRL